MTGERAWLSISMIPQNGIGRFLFFLHIALIAAQWLVPLAAMSTLPETIPVHFDFLGNPDRFASKTSWELWFSPIVSTFLGVLGIALLHFPGTYNVPRRTEIAALPQAQRAHLHDLLREMLLAIFTVVQALMLAVIILIIAFATATSAPFPWLLLIGFVCAPLLVTIVYLVRIPRAVDDAKRVAGIS